MALEAKMAAQHARHNLEHKCRELRRTDMIHQVELCDAAQAHAAVCITHGRHWVPMSCIK